MRMSRRMVIGGIGGDGGVSLSYTGDYDYFGNAAQGFAVLKSSGTLTIKGTVDLCLVGGGGKGYRGYWKSTTSYYGGGGGCGGYVSNYAAQDLDGNFSVTIGAGSSTQGSTGGQTSVGASFTANGGNSPNSYYVSTTGRGTSGRGIGNGISVTNGEDGVYPWNDSANFSSYRVSGCGGGGGRSSSYGLGGAGGGGNGGYDDNPILDGLGFPGTANTGGGGGGAGYDSEATFSGGNGGSGVVFICWGYNHS